MFAQPGCEQHELLAEDEGRITAMPILVLNVHSHCNCRCVMCDIWKRQQSENIVAADLERHRESLHALGVKWVVLTGGEPLLNRDLPALAAFFRELDIRVSLLTTGLLLERRAAEAASSCDDIIISIDGPRDVHDAIRRVQGGFDLIGRGVAEVRRLRPSIPLHGRSTVQRLNYAVMQQTAESARMLGLDSISFLAADLSSEAFNRPLGWPLDRQNSIALSREETDVLEQVVENLIAWSAAEENRGFVAESAAKLRKIVRHFRAHLGQASFESPRCNAPWVSTVVEADGTVRPCFFHKAVGSVRHQTLREVVNGEAARSFRRELSVAGNAVCQKCVCALYHDGLVRR